MTNEVLRTALGSLYRLAIYPLVVGQFAFLLRLWRYEDTRGALLCCYRDRRMLGTSLLYWFAYGLLNTVCSLTFSALPPIIMEILRLFLSFLSIWLGLRLQLVDGLLLDGFSHNALKLVKESFSRMRGHIGPLIRTAFLTLWWILVLMAVLLYLITNSLSIPREYAFLVSPIGLMLIFPLLPHCVMSITGILEALLPNARVRKPPSKRSLKKLQKVTKGSSK